MTAVRLSYDNLDALADSRLERIQALRDVLTRALLALQKKEVYQLDMTGPAPMLVRWTQNETIGYWTVEP